MAKKKNKKTSALTEGHKVLARNKKALRDYEISDRLEAGIVLVGSEVKSLRDSKVTLVDGFVEFKNGEAWLSGININEYPWANRQNHDVDRRRKLLLHKGEIHKLEAKVAQKGFTVIPLAVYFKSGKVKVELGVGRGRREYEKRQVKKEQMAKREMDQAIKRRR